MPLTARKAIQMIVQKGGRKVRAGAAHDIYNVNGTLIAVPRHRGDLSPGVEREIHKELLDSKSHISCGQIAPSLRWRQAALPQVGPPVSALNWSNLTHRLLRDLLSNSS
jgi:hypothetical protein